MEQRLIDTNELLGRVERAIKNSNRDRGYLILGSFVKEMLANCPTVDAESVRHGYWIENHYEFYVLDENYKPVLLNGIGYKCNVCNKDNEKTTDYCPNCGAKMDEVSE